ncbi:MAG: divergent PAP2 family protein [Ruminococcaceae bacterium]|nr:divergent PAP2 family protein [Oscillospiraceae bacterium]
MLDLLWSLVTNFMLASAVFGWFIAQMLKVITGIFRMKKFSVTEMFFGTGGMPSSHTAAVTALACAVAIRLGLGSAEFAMCAILAMIVMRDATGMRRQVGEQAKALNLILQELVESKDPKVTQKALDELAGHTPLQVAAGVIVGVVVPFLVDLIPIFL